MAARINIKNKSREQTGASMVEFSLVALVFFILIFGIIELGLLLFNQQVVTNAGREGARHGIVARPPDQKIGTSEIIKKAREYAEQHIVSFGNKNFDVQATFASGLNHCERFRDVLTVDVTYDYSFLLLPFAKKELGSTAIMICE